ncbi:MAG: glucokinase [Lentimonas sp.]|jgi:glucokinase
MGSQNNIINKLALGIDIGGTNVAFGTVDEQGNISNHSSFKTGEQETAQILIDKIYAYCEENELLGSIIGIGIGAPNGNAKTGRIEFAPNLPWKGIIPLVEMVQTKFNKPALLINDANAAAVGEKMFGAAKNLSDFVSITLGTGLGSGIIINNQLIDGYNGFAGEFGHIRVVPNGRLCGCGRNGCLETYASSTGAVRTYNETHPNEKISAQEIFEKAENGDQFALEVVDYTAEVLGNALADFACFSDPQAYILFSGIAQSGAFFTDKVNFHFEAALLPILKGKIKIITSELHNKNAAILGTAASVFWSNKNEI